MTKVPNWWIEKLAELEHQQWIEWSKPIADYINPAYYSKKLDQWRKCWIPYSKLTEEQKEQDRVWARKVLEILGFPLEVEVGSRDSRKVK